MNIDLSTITQLWWPTLATIVIVTLSSQLIDHFYISNTKKYGRDTRLKRQISKVTLNIIGVVALVLAIPVANDTQQQLLSLVGLVITAVLTLSSTTFVSNGMAGIMLRSVAEFNPGDFIRIGDNFGRITELGLLHTEIQTEDSDLSTLPNLYLITHPFSVIRSHGTLVSANVSLGYDVPRQLIEATLLEAAQACGLNNNFVQVTSLEDHAVCYRVAGKLEEVKQLISARSNLHKKILDCLHQANIEIVSPRFMNQRAIGSSTFIPPQDVINTEDNVEPEASAEQVIFDKADIVESIDDLQQEKANLLARLEKLQNLQNETSKDLKSKYDFRLDYTRQRIEAVDRMLSEYKAQK